MLASMLNLDQLKSALAEANRRFRLLAEKHPDLGGPIDALQKKRKAPIAYLVFSSNRGQAEIGSSPAKILEEFAAMVVESQAKASAMPIVARLKDLKDVTGAAPEISQLRKLLEPIAAQLEYDPQSQIELRFHHLNYELIWKLQSDDLVDRKLTPQTKASIRIVLGTLAEFIEGSH